MKAALLQLTSSDDPLVNLTLTLDLIDQAVGQGASLVLTPEVTNCVSQNRSHQLAVLQHEADDASLAAFRTIALAHQIWLSIGSLALKTDEPDGRFANRSFLIGPDGQIAARYDKIHMFDVCLLYTSPSPRDQRGYRMPSFA